MCNNVDTPVVGVRSCQLSESSSRVIYFPWLLNSLNIVNERINNALLVKCFHSFNTISENKYYANFVLACKVL